MDAGVLAQTAAAFGLGPLLHCERVSSGLGENYRLRTPSGDFHLKRWEDGEEHLELNAELHRRLRAAGLGSAGPLRTEAGPYLAPSGFAAEPWLDAAALVNHSPEALRSFGGYFGRYNRVLRELPWPPWRAGRWIPWDRADSVDWMLGECRAALPWLDMQPDQRQVYERTYALLATYRSELLALPRQVVHGDCGPENVLFSGDQCAAIIDFTPYYECHAYSFAVMAYWWCAYGRQQFDLARLKTIYAAYARYYPWSQDEQTALPALLLRASARILSVDLAFWLDTPPPRAPLELDAQTTAASALVLAAQQSWQPSDLF